MVKKANAIQTTDTNFCDYSTKIEKIEKKIPDHSKYINTPEFNKLTAENLQGLRKLATKGDIADFPKGTDFNGKLKQIYKKDISNKTRHLEGEKNKNYTIVRKRV